MKLLPCIKCNNEELSIVQKGYDLDIVFVQCRKCGKTGPRRKTFHGAQIAWNKEIKLSRTLKKAIESPFKENIQELIAESDKKKLQNIWKQQKIGFLRAMNK